MPQAPQLFGSLVVSTQGPPSTHCESEPQVHALVAQAAPEGQTLLQPPQLFGSPVVSMQAPLQRLSEPVQPHALLVQVAPEGHARPQPLQLALSFLVSTQAPLQRRSEPVQTHAPPAQCVAEGQAPASQPPQWLALVDVLTHAPLQSISAPASVVGQAHAPLMQLCPVAHLLAHRPQLLGSLFVSTQVPLHIAFVPEHVHT